MIFEKSKAILFLWQCKWSTPNILSLLACSCSIHSFTTYLDYHLSVRNQKLLTKFFVRVNYLSTLVFIKFEPSSVGQSKTVQKELQLGTWTLKKIPDWHYISFFRMRKNIYFLNGHFFSTSDSHFGISYETANRFSGQLEKKYGKFGGSSCSLSSCFVSYMNNHKIF